MLLGNIKNILIGFVPSEQSPSRALAYGLSLAAQANAHMSVQALSMRVAVPQIVETDLVNTLIASENSRRQQQAEAVVERVKADALAQGVPCTAEAPQMVYPDLASAFAARARVHDLAILDADPEFLSLAEGILHHALFDSGRPVLVVPSITDQFRCKRVMIAWDGSAKAARALNDALPFLRVAEQVELMSVAGEKDLSRSVPGAEVAPHLERHGVEVLVKELVTQNGDVGDVLRNEASVFGADMVVMGAFVHSRLRELVFGGVTQSMLKECTVPLFLSH